MRVRRGPSVFTCRSIINGFTLKRLAHFTAAWGRSEPFQGSWAYLGPHGVTPRAIAHFLGAWEAREKEGVFLFCSESTTAYIQQDSNLEKVLYLLQPPNNKKELIQKSFFSILRANLNK